MGEDLFGGFDFFSGTTFFMFNIIITFLMIFFPIKFWMYNSRYMFIVLNLFYFLEKEFKIMLGNFSVGVVIYITFFMYVLQFNVFGMFPYSFTLTSQLSTNLYFSLTFFFIFFLLGWLKMYNMMFTHLTPMSSPMVLTPFLVLIELISLIIRPMTLSIRLTANIVSGHILMEILLAPSGDMMSLLKFMYYFIMLPIFFLEMSVCFIQAYVISSLSLMYLSEIKNH